MSRIEVRYQDSYSAGVTESRWLCPDTLYLYTTKEGTSRARHFPLKSDGKGRWTTQTGIALVEPVRASGQGGPILPGPVADNTKEGRKIGKVRMDLVVKDMPRAIEALARVMTWALSGEKGYAESDWLHVPGGIQKYHGGLHRHDNKEMRGQTFDDESGLHHAIHTAWNAMARVELILREEEAKND